MAKVNLSWQVFDDLTNDLALNPQKTEDDKWKIANNTGVPPSLQGTDQTPKALDRLSVGLSAP